MLLKHLKLKSYKIVDFLIKTKIMAFFIFYLLIISIYLIVLFLFLLEIIILLKMDYYNEITFY